MSMCSHWLSAEVVVVGCPCAVLVAGRMATAMEEVAKRRERNDTVYFWDSREGKAKQARVERYSTKAPTNIVAYTAVTT